MINNDIKNYFPKILLENISDDGQALIDYLNTFIDTIKAETIDLKTFFDSDRMPASMIDELGYYIKTFFLSSDTELIKRQKIKDSITTHKKWSLWATCVKLICDAQTGHSATLYNSTDSDAVFIGDPHANWSPYHLTTHNWRVFEGSALPAWPLYTADYGWQMIGDGNMDVVYGVVCIDLGYPSTHLVCHPWDDVFEDGSETYDTEHHATVSGGTGGSLTAEGLEAAYGVYIADGSESYATSDVTALKISLLQYMPAYYRVFLGYTDVKGMYVIQGEII